MSKKGQWSHQLVQFLLMVVIIILVFLILRYFSPIKEAILGALDNFLNIG